MAIYVILYNFSKIGINSTEQRDKEPQFNGPDFNNN